jgi:uncharacterized membrane protein
MNRQEFLNELENLLQNIPSADRQEAIQYYQDYFEDAGVENEEQVIRELGSPQRVAAIIQEDLKNEATVEKGEFTEKGYHNPAFENRNADSVVKVETPNYQNANQGNGTQGYSENGFNPEQNVGNMNNQQQKEPTYVYEYSKIPKVLLIIGAILFIPVGIPLICTAFGIIVAIISVVFSLVVAFGAVSFGLTIGGVITLVAGIAQIFTLPMVAFLVSGVGLVLIGIGLLFAIATRFCAKLIPMTIRGIVNICRLPFRRRVMA